MTRRNALRCAGSLLAIAVGTATAGAAYAQNTSSTTAGTEASQGVAEIVVTGSRVAVGADAPTPVTSVTPDAINQIQQANIADALIQLPALRSSVTSQVGGEGGALGSSLNLRGLGPLRTLTLVDGQRFVPTLQFGLSTGQEAVNVESIPQLLIKRVDVVTGGASAAYGSDAVAGVVNFVLDDKFKGFKAQITGGQTQRNDARNYAAEFAAGASFGPDERLHVILDANFARDEGVPNDPLGLHGRRAWMDDARTIGSESVAGVRSLITGARYWQYPLAGLVDGCLTGGSLSNGVVTGGAQKGLGACPVYGVGFNDAGTSDHPYDFGVRKSGTASRYAVGGEGSQPGPQSVIDTPSMRHGVYGRVSYDLNPTTNIYLDYLTQETEDKDTAGHITPQFIDSSRPYGFEVGQDNPYIPADLLAAMKANNVSALNISKIMNYSTHQAFDARTNRISVGFKHDFNDNWSANGYYTYGHIDSTMTLTNFSNVDHLYNAIHSVVAPTAGATYKAGDIVCASTLAGAKDGCVPWNPFGDAAYTKAQQAYLSPTDYYYSANDQQAAEVSIKGSTFTLPAGPVDVAFGAGYRQESVSRTSDALGESQLPNAFNPQIIGALSYLNNPAIQGSTHNWELFGESEIPILKNVPFAQSLDANIAARYTDYSNGGGVATWKGGLTYTPVDGVRLRAAYSRDVRAPNLIELFSPASSGYSLVADPLSGGASVAFASNTVGNPNLKPEDSNTFTLGAVFQPNFLPGFYSSVDYFDIKMTGQIVALAVQTIVNQCYGANGTAQVTSSCSLIQRGTPDPTTGVGQITSITLPTENLASSETSGMDIELGYNRPIDFWKFKGGLSLHSYMTYYFKEATTSVPGATPVDTAPQPNRFVLLATADYKTGPWTFGLQEHFTNGGIRSVSLPPYVGDTQPSAVWTDLIFRRQFGKYEGFATIQNLFDKDPPVNYFTGPNSGSASINGDPLGRRFLIGVKVQL